MKKLVLCMATAVALLAVSSLSWAQPPNDTCETATVIIAGTTYFDSGTTCGGVDDYNMLDCGMSWSTLGLDVQPEKQTFGVNVFADRGQAVRESLLRRVPVAGDVIPTEIESEYLAPQLSGDIDAIKHAALVEGVASRVAAIRHEKLHAVRTF